MRVLLFTDTLGDVNGVCRFILDMGEQASRAGRALHIATSTRMAAPDRPYIANVPPRWAVKIPRYPQLELAAPPMRRLLRLARRLEPDAIHISTPGPIGLVGLRAANMLSVPALGVYHTDFPAYIDRLYGASALADAAADSMRWFYTHLDSVLVRSEAYLEPLTRLGVAREKLVRMKPGVALDSFSPELRDSGVWREHGINLETVKVLYVGRVSVEKNLRWLAQLWPALRRACAGAGAEAELIVVGDGPLRSEMEKKLIGAGAHFLGVRRGPELSRLYASADVFVFPSTTDTLGQVALEAQASGLPAVVSDIGGPREIVIDGETGFVCSASRPREWTRAVARLASNAQMRRRFGRAARRRASCFSLRDCFEQFCAAHVEALRVRRRRT